MKGSYTFINQNDSQNTKLQIPYDQKKCLRYMHLYFVWVKIESVFFSSILSIYTYIETLNTISMRGNA
jgi:hypothetical protein